MASCLSRNPSTVTLTINQVAENGSNFHGHGLKYPQYFAARYVTFLSFLSVLASANFGLKFAAVLLKQ